MYNSNYTLSKCNTESLSIISKINQQLAYCCRCEKLPVFGLDWQTDLDNPCSDSSWVISNNNTQLRFNIEDSKNCGGNCDKIQRGSAVANITVGPRDVFLNLDFDGIGELQAPNYELIYFNLDGTKIADAHAAGGNYGCNFGPVLKTYHVTGPYKLLKGTKHRLEVNFTTNDNLFHKSCYYQVNLSFTY